MVNHLARRGKIEVGSELFGKAFENWVFHELSLHSSYSQKFYDLSYWRLSSGSEVDFIIGDGEIAVEAKGKKRISSNDTKGLLQFIKDFPKAIPIVVCLEDKDRITDEGVKIMNYKSFMQKLWNNAL